MSNVSVGSATQLTATLTLAGGATPGARNVTVTNPERSCRHADRRLHGRERRARTLTLAYNGMLRDRVGQGDTALGSDGALDGTLTATLSATGGRTITALRLDSTRDPGTWDTTGGNGSWVLAVAPSLDGALLNAPGTMAVNFPVANGGSFVLFACGLPEHRVPAGPHPHAHRHLLRRLHGHRHDHGAHERRDDQLRDAESGSARSGRAGHDHRDRLCQPARP